MKKTLAYFVIFCALAYQLFNEFLLFNFHHEFYFKKLVTLTCEQQKKNTNKFLQR